MFSRDAVPADQRHRFVWLLRTSPMMNRLARGEKPDENGSAPK